MKFIRNALRPKRSKHDVQVSLSDLVDQLLVLLVVTFVFVIAVIDADQRPAFITLAISVLSSHGAISVLSSNGLMSVQKTRSSQNNEE
jgi:hypothetical protein